MHLSINRYLGCFHPLAVVNNAAMNMDVQLLLQDPAFNLFGYILRCRIAGSYGSSICTFFRYFYTVTHSGCTI